MNSYTGKASYLQARYQVLEVELILCGVEWGIGVERVSVPLEVEYGNGKTSSGE